MAREHHRPRHQQRPAGGLASGSRPPGRGTAARSRIGRLLAFATACLLLLPLPARAQGTVTILHFNDVYEITPVEAGKAGGLARLARFGAELKARQPGLIITLGPTRYRMDVEHQWEWCSFASLDSLDLHQRVRDEAS